MPDNLLVGVPTLNGAERVFSLLRSFETFPPKIECDFLVVDDGSDNRDADVIQEVCALFKANLYKHLDNKGKMVNLGVSAGWNTIRDYAIRHKYAYVLILNDDIQILPNAIDSAYEVLHSNEDLGIIGIPPLHTSGTGLILRWPENLSYDAPYRCHWPPGCSFGISIEALQTIGPFDTQFIAHFEDVDYAFRCTQAGLMNVVIPQGVLHAWSATFKSNPKTMGHLRLEISRRLFRQKWGATSDDLWARTKVPDRPLTYRSRAGEIVTLPIPYAIQ